MGRVGFVPAAVLLLVLAVAAHAELSYAKRQVGDRRRPCEITRRDASMTPCAAAAARQLQQPSPQYTPCQARRCVRRGLALGEEYWTSIGYDGKLRGGRTTQDFITFPDVEGYIAFWITQSRYADTHYEVFGHAFIREDGRVCANFAGQANDVAEVCGGFRVLSRNSRNPGEEIPFEWVSSQEGNSERTIGYHKHRISKHIYHGINVYGDASIKSKTFIAANPNQQDIISIVEPDYSERIWLLRRRYPASASLPVYSGYRQPTSVQRYADPHASETIEQRVDNSGYGYQSGQQSGQQTSDNSQQEQQGTNVQTVVETRGEQQTGGSSQNIDQRYLSDPRYAAAYQDYLERMRVYEQELRRREEERKQYEAARAEQQRQYEQERALREESNRRAHEEQRLRQQQQADYDEAVRRSEEARAAQQQASYDEALRRAEENRAREEEQQPQEEPGNSPKRSNVVVGNADDAEGRAVGEEVAFTLEQVKKPYVVRDELGNVYEREN